MAALLSMSFAALSTASVQEPVEPRQGSIWRTVLNRMPDEPSAPGGPWVTEVFVEPDAQGTGVGRALFARSIYLMGGVTLAAARGRGVYKALVAARLAFAREHGVALATSHARSETSAPILERLGFETLCHYENYNFTP